MAGLWFTQNPHLTLIHLLDVKARYVREFAFHYFTARFFAPLVE